MENKIPQEVQGIMDMIEARVMEYKKPTPYTIIFLRHNLGRGCKLGEGVQDYRIVYEICFEGDRASRAMICKYTSNDYKMLIFHNIMGFIPLSEESLNSIINPTQKTRSFCLGSKVKFQYDNEWSELLNEDIRSIDYCLLGFDSTRFILIKWEDRGGIDIIIKERNIYSTLELVD